MNIRKFKKGFTIVEVLVALTLLGVVSIPITMSLMNTQKADELNLEQLKTSAIVRIVRENVVNAVKSQGCILGYNDSVHRLVVSPGHFTDLYDLEITDGNANKYDSYRFNAEYKGTGTYKTIMYEVTVLKIDNKGSKNQIRKFNIEVNQLP